MAESSGLGRRIFQARKQLEAKCGRVVSQAEIGAALGVTGVAVGSWEGGKKEPDLATIARLALALDVSPGWLAFGGGEDLPVAEDDAPATIRPGAKKRRSAG